MITMVQIKIKIIVDEKSNISMKFGANTNFLPFNRKLIPVAFMYIRFCRSKLFPCGRKNHLKFALLQKAAIWFKF